MVDLAVHSTGVASQQAILNVPSRAERVYM